jgi:uncharacterized protein YndB with AHSA1/START domain
MSTTEALAAINKTITVDASVETAFETFTRQIGSWWPIKTHSILEERVEGIVFDEREGGRLYERAENGEEADWADVLAWEPPSRFVLRWRVNPERGPTEVAEGRAGYDPGWDFVLGHYVESFKSE